MQPKAPANTIPFKIENVFEIQMHRPVNRLALIIIDPESIFAFLAD